MVAIVPDVHGGSEKSLEVVSVVTDVSSGSGRSVEVVAGVPDVHVTFTSVYNGAHSASYKRFE